MVLDTETTGLTPRAPIHDTRAWDRCRVVQVAWSVHDASGAPLTKRCLTVQPDGFEIPEQAARIHGITTANASVNGSPIQQVLLALHDDLERFDVGTLVAHNMEFDDTVLQAEMWRYRCSDLLNRFQVCERRCTMLMGTHPGKKWPRLAELYQELFGEAPGKCHQADLDVEYCSRIFWHFMAKNALKSGDDSKLN